MTGCSSVAPMSQACRRLSRAGAAGAWARSGRARERHRAQDPARPVDAEAERAQAAEQPPASVVREHAQVLGLLRHRHAVERREHDRHEVLGRCAPRRARSRPRATDPAEPGGSPRSASSVGQAGAVAAEELVQRAGARGPIAAGSSRFHSSTARSALEHVHAGLGARRSRGSGARGSSSVRWRMCQCPATGITPKLDVEGEVRRRARRPRRPARSRGWGRPASSARAGARPMPRPWCSGITISSVSSSMPLEAHHARVAHRRRRRPRRSRSGRRAGRR